MRSGAARAFGRSTSLDVYIWLAYRLHTLRAPIPVRWAALREQFGTGYAKISAFRRDFLTALGQAVSAYPEARVDLADEGVVLYPSRPPVAPRLTAVSASSNRDNAPLVRRR